MRNFPEADKLAKRFKAMLPPQVQQAEAEEDKPAEIPPEVQQAMEMAAQEIQQLRQALQEAQRGAQEKMAIEQMRQQTTLAKTEMDNDAKRDIEELKGVVQMLMQQIMPPPQLMGNVAQDLQT
jgi:uncharacterized membrane protein YccC